MDESMTKPRIDKYGEPCCSTQDCPSFMDKADTCGALGAPGPDTSEDDPCLPCIIQQRNEAQRQALRWQAMFEHTAKTLEWLVEEYGLAGDEATEEIARWVELAEKE